jgi:hypothetical protein
VVDDIEDLFQVHVYNDSSFGFAVTCNTRSAELTAEALPIANASFRLGVYKNLNLVSSIPGKQKSSSDVENEELGQNV